MYFPMCACDTSCRFGACLVLYYVRYRQSSYPCKYGRFRVCDHQGILLSLGVHVILSLPCALRCIRCIPYNDIALSWARDGRMGTGWAREFYKNKDGHGMGTDGHGMGTDGHARFMFLCVHLVPIPCPSVPRRNHVTQRHSTLSHHVVCLTSIAFRGLYIRDYIHKSLLVPVLRYRYRFFLILFHVSERIPHKSMVT